MEILKTGVLHEEMCVQSLWETVNCRDKRKEKEEKKLHKDAFLGRGVHVCVFVVCDPQYVK